MYGFASVMGFCPENLNYCPECGYNSFPSTEYADGKLECSCCGLVCYIIEADESHEKKGTQDDG